MAQHIDIGAELFGAGRPPTSREKERMWTACTIADVEPPITSDGAAATAERQQEQ